MAFKEQLFAVLCVNHQKQGKDKDGTEKVAPSLWKTRDFWAQLAALFSSFQGIFNSQKLVQPVIVG